MDLNLSMFRAYDIRTPAEDFPNELAVRLARAEAIYFRETLGAPGVLLAHDARLDGPRCLEIGAEEFARAGLSVTVIPGASSTSLFYFAAMQRPELAGIMYGASHNPAGHTGQKILGPGVRPIARDIGPDGGLTAIQALYARGASERRGISCRGRISVCDPLESYLRFSMELAGVRPGTLEGEKVFHDYLNGAAGREMIAAFERAGAELRPLHFVPNGRFPLGDPNPVKRSVVQPGLTALREDQFLLGAFFDGDGDRIDIYGGDGGYLASSFVYAAILPAIRERFPGDAGVFADLKCNPLAVVEMARAGFRVDVIRNGHSQIKSALFEDPSRAGAVEESAHFYEAFQMEGKRFCTENTLYIALLTARMWKENPHRIAELSDLQARTSREREWGYKFESDRDRAAALDAVRAHFEALGLASMDRMANGYDLEATLMRRGIPFTIDASTELSGEWLQVCQRESQSEAGLARWEVVAARADIAAQAKQEIAAIARQFGASDEYQG